MAEAFDRSSWDGFLYAIRDGKATTTYDYTIAGQLASLTTRNLELRTDSSESFLWDGLALIRRGGVNYLNEPHAGGGAALLAGGHQKSAKPKPVAWGDRDFEAVRRHGARSGRPRRSGNVMFNDVLGTTLGTADKQDTFAGNRSTAFGEGDTDALFTGKPYVEGLGHAFLLRNYRADLGKWQTADPLGHPDGWNTFAYCNGQVTSAVDLYGAYVITCRDVYSGTTAYSANTIGTGVYVPKGEDDNQIGGFEYKLYDAKLINGTVYITIDLKIEIIEGLVEESKWTGTEVTYLPHDSNWFGIIHNQFRQVVVAHERGHAKSFFDSTLFGFRVLLAGIDTAAANLTHDELKSVVGSRLDRADILAESDSGYEANVATRNAFGIGWEHSTRGILDVWRKKE